MMSVSAAVRGSVRCRSDWAIVYFSVRAAGRVSFRVVGVKEAVG